jgi:hypothetical protein
MAVFVTEYPQFIIAAIKGRYKLLEYDKYKNFVVKSLQFRHDNGSRKKHAVDGVFLHRPHGLKSTLVR